jgi:4-hydroxythreonine-4-phosphate dehydrogenase
LPDFGPFGADGFFGSGVFTRYDAALSMYHDQGLIPFKTMAFENGVNYTAGLSIVRTSPDHGTAYDLAGKNIASESSFRYAVYAAIDILAQRKLQAEISVNPLKISMQKRERDR